tara:strand:+ start:4804 stop:10521 length:5718 start_codon:yes stop_codon:yes gene_type:complete
MAKTTRNFIVGRMNKSVDERLVPNGEYIHAENVRLGSTESSEIGSVENSKGNKLIVTPEYPAGTTYAFTCLGALADAANETIYWFVHANDTGLGAAGKLDMIVSYNKQSSVITNHVVSLDDGGSVNTTLNFNSKYLINSINKVENLLFFSDNINPPRFIDLTKNYADPIGNIDQFTAESILVIKKPPVTAPSLRQFSTSQKDTYMNERLVCFAYRYKYANNEYSATSQWTLPAFTPKPFTLSLESSLNEGMINAFNSVELTYNTGSSLVTEIEVLYKESASNTINVIESFNKSDLGLGDDNNETMMFDNNKIFTILADSEILRLYDNVPLLAKAQTVMGNRLMYGNYIEGYDLLNTSDAAIQFNYLASLKETVINEETLPATFSLGSYDIDCSGGSAATTSSVNAVMTIYLTDDGLSTGGPLDLLSGMVLDFDVDFLHQQFTGDTSGGFTAPTATTPLTNMSLSFTFPRDYVSAYDLATSSEFVAFMGSPTNIQKVVDCAEGTTISDRFNCLIPQTLAGASGGTTTNLTKCWSGTKDQFCTGNSLLFDTEFATLGIITNGANTTSLGIQLMAMAYVDTCMQSGGVSATQVVYEYYQFSAIEATLKTIGTLPSLKSNRNYEVAIVYMDDFLRSSTPITSPNNTVAVPCSNSISRNEIRIEIPVTMHPPNWATRYKFCVQPDRSGYETVYTNLFFNDPKSARIWCLLEGENAQKVEKGDRLIVKRGSNGPTSSCIYTTVLEKEVQTEDFIAVSVPGSDIDAVIPAGAYMAVTPLNWTASIDPSALFNPGTNGMFTSSQAYFKNPSKDSDYGPQVGYLLCTKVNSDSPTTTDPEYADVDVPQGSIINMNFRFARIGPGDGDKSCERVIYELELNGLVSQNSYSNMYDWFVGDNIESLLDDGDWEVGDSGSDGTFVLVPDLYYSTGGVGTTYQATASGALYTATQEVKGFKIRFWRNNDTLGTNSTTNEFGISVRGGRACGSSENRRSRITMSIQVFKSDNTLVFETEPTDAAPGIFFEGSDTFNITNNFHESGTADDDQNQTASDPALITIDASNCYAFGNGVESNKIRDSIAGKGFNLGNRVYGASEQIYKRAHRFADITYSGIYNDESNINKLNEFNLGLINFKPLEDSYGTIEVLAGRKTDVLCLQEDKISYVLAGKNLLSDAAGGSALTSVPEVLGMQISRIEKYGISNNPESYTEWGADKFFTDVKRGAIIQLKGASADSERLGVISEVGMRGYFRDLFNESFLYQKIGGFDPYMNEYVLSINNNVLPSEDIRYACGVSNTFLVTATSPVIILYQLTEVSGNARLDYSFNEGTGSTTTIEAEYVDGSGVTQTVSSGAVSVDGYITVLRDVPTITQVQITITQTAGSQNLTINQACPLANTLKVVQVCLTNDDENLLSSYNQYYWNTFDNDPQPAPPYYTNPTFTSTTTSTFVDFAEGSSPVVSQYAITTGLTGLASFPPNTSYVTMVSNKIPPANFVFSFTQDYFYWLESNTLYENNTNDIQLLLTAASLTANKTEEEAGVRYSGQFARTINNTYLYLIWDYRTVKATMLSYQAGTSDYNADIFAACCENTQVAYFLDGATLSSSSVVYTDINLNVVAADGYYSDGEWVRLQKLGILQSTDACACGLACDLPVGTYIVFKTEPLVVYRSTHTWTTVGAVVIWFNPNEAPVGIKVTYDGIVAGTVYNKWVSSSYGDVAPNSLNTPVFLGKTGSGTVPTTGNYTVAELNSQGHYQVIPNTTQYVSVGAGQIKTTLAVPQSCYLVVPATSTSIKYLNIEIYNLISAPSEYLEKGYKVYCPDNLLGFTSSNTTRTTVGAACLDANDDINLYRLPAIYTSASVGVHDQIFANNNGDLAVNTDASSPGHGNRAFSAGGWVRIEEQPNNVTAIELNDESIVIATSTSCAP